MFLRNKSRHVKTFNEGRDRGSALTQAYWEGKGENFFDYFTRAEVTIIINDNLKFPILRFFTQTLLSGKWPSVLKLFSDH